MSVPGEFGAGPTGYGEGGRDTVTPAGAPDRGRLADAPR